MISLSKLHKMADASFLLPPPGGEVVLELLQEIYRLHSKLETINHTSTELKIQELAREDIYHET